MQIEHLFLKERGETVFTLHRRSDEEEVREAECLKDEEDPRRSLAEYEQRFQEYAEKAVAAARRLGLDVKASSDGMQGWIELVGERLNFDIECRHPALYAIDELTDKAVWRRLSAVQRYGKTLFCIRLGFELYHRVSAEQL